MIKNCITILGKRWHFRAKRYFVTLQDYELAEMPEEINIEWSRRKVVELLTHEDICYAIMEIKEEDKLISFYIEYKDFEIIENPDHFDCILGGDTEIFTCKGQTRKSITKNIKNNYDYCWIFKQEPDIEWEKHEAPKRDKS